MNKYWRSRQGFKKEAKILISEFEVPSARSKKWFALEDNWLKTNFNTRETGFYPRMFQRYVSGEEKIMKCYFMLPLEVKSNHILLISILMHLQSNMFNMTWIIFRSVAWHLLYMIPENMFHNRILPHDLNILYSVNNLAIRMVSSLPIKWWHIVLVTRETSVVVIRLFNEKKRRNWCFK